AGLSVVGEYIPYDGAHIIVVTNDYLKRLAGRQPNATYLAGLRVSVTKTPVGVQVAYMNPRYFSHAYRIDEDLQSIASLLENTLGATESFGAKGLSAKKLKRYQYGFGMEYFDDELELAKYTSQAEAVAAVDSSLKSGVGGSQFVYRIDIPGVETTVFGVGMSRGMSSDAAVMQVADHNTYKQTAHLPYELVVQRGRVLALAPRFRIAIDFPDLKMTGKHGFTKLMATPDAIRKTLTEVAGGEWIDPVWQAMDSNN
ncbi:MAG: hypothetical protein MI754_09885, partial [Chromatiales bacterium]|nr:hypothetical protein [Chromatiales bacterium]